MAEKYRLYHEGNVASQIFLISRGKQSDTPFTKTALASLARVRNKTAESGTRQEVVS